jgi:hypothetical protein
MPSRELACQAEFVIEFIVTMFIAMPGMHVPPSAHPYRYTVKWLGYPHSQNTHEPLESFPQKPDGTYPALVEFHRNEQRKAKLQLAADLHRARHGVKVVHLLQKAIKRQCRDFLTHNNVDAFKHCMFGSTSRLAKVACSPEMWKSFLEQSPPLWAFKKSAKHFQFSSKMDFIRWLSKCAPPPLCCPRALCVTPSCARGFTILLLVI